MRELRPGTLFAGHRIEALVASGTVAPYQGRDIVPDLGDPMALAAALAPTVMARAS